MTAPLRSASPSSPYPSSWTVRCARDAYLAENGFTLDGYDAPYTEGAFLGMKVKVPNTARHRWAIMLHDLHHVATGFGTDLAGEGEISAWELRRGIRGLGLYVGAIVLMGSGFGIALAPRRALAAWRSSGERDSLFTTHDRYTTREEYEALLEMTVGELRAMLGVPDGGVARVPRALHSRAPRVRAAAA